jgi:PAS domain S-box-containing protein
VIPVAPAAGYVSSTPFSLIHLRCDGSYCARRDTIEQKKEYVMITADALQQTGSNPLHANAGLANDDEHGMLRVDRMGRIRGSGASAENLFGASQARLIGRRISEFIAGLFLEGNSPSYNARYLAYLCADGEWRRFEARDTNGHMFSVEINLSRRVTDGQECFALNLRRLGERSCS